MSTAANLLSALAATPQLSLEDADLEKAEEFLLSTDPKAEDIEALTPVLHFLAQYARVSTHFAHAIVDKARPVQIDVSIAEGMPLCY